MQLRPYQMAAVAAARQQIKNGKGSVLFVSPTGSGKTLVVANLISLAVCKGKVCDFMSHRAELNTQCAAKLVEAGIPRDSIAIYGGGKIIGDPNAPVRVGSVQTLHGVGARKSDLLFVDEAHRSMAKQHQTLIAGYRSYGARVLGFTATPERLDGNSLGEVYEEMVIIARPSELVAEGFIVNPTIFTVPERELPKLDDVSTSRGDFAQAELAQATQRPELVGSVVEHWIKRARRKSICFAVNRDHSRSIVDAFRAKGIPALHIDGNSTDAERVAAITKLRNGEVQVVSQCELWIEGVDIPEVRCAILARPTQSVTIYLQSVGRVVRPYRGEEALVLDHAGNVRRLGLPMDDREWTLEKRRRKSVHESSAKACPMCYMVVSLNTRECPGCGSEFNAEGSSSRVIKVSREELVLLREREVWAKRYEQWLRYWEDAWTTKDPAAQVHRKFVARYHVVPKPEWTEPERSGGKDVEHEWLRKMGRQAFFGKIPWSRVEEMFVRRFGHKPHGRDALSTVR